MEKREIPKKNYLILAGISILTVCLVIYIASWYRTITEYNNSNSVMTEVLSKLEKESFSSFLIDNPNIIIYASSTLDSELKPFEKKFKKYVTEEDIQSEIVYVNLNDEANKEILTDFKEKYFSSKIKKVETIVDPNLLAFQNGEIVDILYLKKRVINMDDVKKFLKRNEIINND